MHILPSTKITYEVFISDNDLKEIINFYYHHGTYVNLNYCIYKQERPDDSLWFTVSNSNISSFCADENMEMISLSISVGSLSREIAIIYMNDMDKSISNLKNAIWNAIVENRNVADRIAKFKHDIVIKFDDPEWTKNNIDSKVSD